MNFEFLPQAVPAYTVTIYWYLRFLRGYEIVKNVHDVIYNCHLLFINNLMSV